MYIVKQSSAKMPTSCKHGRYVRIGVLEVEPRYQDVSMISERARGVIRVVETWERVCVGKTERSAAAVAMREAMALCADLNAGEKK